MNIGRQKKADPKWLVPLICRLGREQKRDIGAIRIFARDTRFEISGEARADFMAALPKDDPEGIVIVPSSAPVASAGPGPGQDAWKRAKGDRR